MNTLPRWCLVDTNVAIVANGKSEQANDDLVDQCIQVLLDLTHKGGLVLDEGGEIFEEYRKNLSLKGQPGTGDIFMKWVHDHQWNAVRCERRVITSRSDAQMYEEFPVAESLEDFDRSDRKFVAVANAAEPKRPILEAVDFKWWGWREALAAEGIEVIFLDEKAAQAGYAKHLGNV
jgi:hypothetical protein